MKKFSIFTAFTILSLSLLLISCSSELISKRNITEYNSVLAETAGGYSITVPEFYDKVYRGEYFSAGAIAEPDDLEPILDSIILDTLIGMEAETIDMKEYPDAENRYRVRTIDLMLKAFFDEMILPRISFDSSDVFAHYQGDSTRYWVKEQVHAYNLLIKESGLLEGPDSAKYKGMTDDQLKQAALDYTHEVLARMKEGKSFPSLVEEYSHDRVSARQRGDMEWVQRNRYKAPFDSVAFALKPGEVSGPYYDDEGWHVIYVEDRYDEGLPPMTDEIFQFCLGNMISDTTMILKKQIIDSIMALDREVVYNEPILDKDPLRTDGQIWAAVVDGKDTIPVFDLRTVERKSRLRGGGVASAQERRGFVDELVRTYAVVRSALDIQVDTLPTVAPHLYMWRHEYIRNVLRARQYDKAWDPPESMIQEYYDKHIDRYQSDHPLHVWRIVMADSAMAEYVRDLAQAGTDFLELAQQHYDAPEGERRKLAEVGWIGADYKDTVLYQLARITGDGYVSKVKPVKDGYLIVKLVEVFPAKTVEQARTEITNILKDKHAEKVYAEFRDEMFDKYSVKKSSLSRMHFPPLDFREL